MITPENILQHELLGLHIRIITSTNKNQEGIKGIVVNETRNTIVISTDDGEKTVMKDQCKFSFKINFNWINVEGKLLVARPEDRIKKKQKKW